MEYLFLPIVLLWTLPGLAFLPAGLFLLWVNVRWSRFGPLQRFFTGGSVALWFLYAPYETYMYFWMKKESVPIRIDMLLIGPILYTATIIIVVNCLRPGVPYANDNSSPARSKLIVPILILIVLFIAALSIHTHREPAGNEAVVKIITDEKGTATPPMPTRGSEGPPHFVPFDKAPVITKRANPQYPEAAREASMEGTVWTRMWVDKQGKVKKIEIQKSDAEIFNQGAIDAAMQFEFTPAMQAGEPVEVWVTIPFHFRLK
jgi:protein TonB